MAQVINTNITSLNSQRHLNQTNSALSRAMERLSSGKRINSAKDDAAGLGISARMTTQVNGMNQAIRNANDGISMSQTAEGALSTSEEMLQRIRTLAVQSSNATNASIDRQAMQDEVNQLTAELNRIAQTTTFNGQNILNGTMGVQNYQVGANAGELITATGTNFQTDVYGNNRVYTSAVKAANDTAGDADTDTTKAALSDKIMINGRLGNESVDLSGMSAKEAAAAVNALSAKTDVTATARTEAMLVAKTGKSYSFKLASNNYDLVETGGDAESSKAVTVSFTMGETDDADGYAAAINAINAVSAKTGVTAEFSTMKLAADGSEVKGIKLTNADGETISIGETTTIKADLYNVQYDSETDEARLSAKLEIAAYAVADADSDEAIGTSVVGTVTFDSQASFSITQGDSTAALKDFGNNTTGSASKLKSVASLDVTSFSKAQLALEICDAAINVINAERAKYGALQSRFESTIKNLEVNSENTSNARSRIQDADYASETAELSRASILQQAGTAMLAQANQLPQTVLSLIG